MRDLLIGAPVFWMHSPMPIVLCAMVAIAAWVVPLRWWPQRALEWFDGLGLAAYAVYGAGKALTYGIAPLPAAVAGIITACLGGIVRDVTAGVPSVLMRHELYVTAAACAAFLFVALSALGGVVAQWAALVSVGLGFLIRAAAIQWGLSLPPHRGH